MADEKKIDTFNKFLVGLRGETIVIVSPPLAPLSVDDALLLAAYLVVMADPDGEKFEAVKAAVENA
jgi:hypothetical protein